MPWRNGGGVTLEIAREPGGGDVFAWRLSLATVAASGPFSDFAGYQRSVTLIDGEGFKLGIGGQDPVVLDWPGATALFPGSAPAQCELLKGPATDLSLMVREPGAIVSVVRIHNAGTLTVPLDPGTPGTLKALFCLSAGTVLGTDVRAQIRLTVHDTVLLDHQATTVSLDPSPGMSIDALLLTWTTPAANPTAGRGG
jgi:uncharacterized protein